MIGSRSGREKGGRPSSSSATKHAVFVVLAILLGGAAGLAALLGAATVTDRTPLFLLAGLVAFCAVYLLGLVPATRGVSTSRRGRVRVWLFCLGAAVAVGLFAWTALLPMDDPCLPPAPVAKQHFWELSSGSRIAYVHVPAEGEAHDTPLIFLHGGPGTPDMAGDSEYFGQLAEDGFDVYVYDELGAPPGSGTPEDTASRATSRIWRRSARR